MAVFKREGKILLKWRRESEVGDLEKAEALSGVHKALCLILTRETERYRRKRRGKEPGEKERGEKEDKKASTEKG